MILLMYCQIHFANMLLKIFTSMFIRDVGLYTGFLSDVVFVWFWCQGNDGIIKSVRKLSFLFIYLFIRKSLRSMRVC